MSPAPWQSALLRRRWRRAARRAVLHPVEAFLFFAGRFIFSRLSLDAASRLAGWFGRFPLAGFLSFRRAERNLAIIMPDLNRMSRRRLARRVTGGLASTMVEYLHTRSLIREPDRIEIAGEAHARRALESGGVVFATAHIANPEACRIAILRLGGSPALYYRPPSNPMVRGSIRETLEVIDAPLFGRGIDHPRHMRRHVGEGGAILILVDQRMMGADRLPFLGKMARTTTGPATLARRAGAAFVPVRCKRLPGRRLAYQVSFEAPIERKDSTEVMSEMNARIGEWVREAPDQWLWVHDRWR